MRVRRGGRPPAPERSNPTPAKAANHPNGPNTLDFMPRLITQIPPRVQGMRLLDRQGTTDASLLDRHPCRLRRPPPPIHPHHPHLTLILIVIIISNPPYHHPLVSLPTMAWASGRASRSLGVLPGMPEPSPSPSRSTRHCAYTLVPISTQPYTTHTHTHTHNAHVSLNRPPDCAVASRIGEDLDKIIPCRLV
jgi:hypothetical protein